MGDADMDELFAGVGAKRGVSAIAGAEESEQKRVNLRRSDHLVVQSLMPFDTSPLSEVKDPELWAYAKKGNKYVENFSELCSDDKYKVGVGLSRHAHLLLQAGLMLNEPKTMAILDSKVLENAMKEFKVLKPHLTILDIGTSALRSSGVPSSMASFKKKNALVADAAAIEKAAKAFFNYYAKASALRGLLCVLGRGGVSFNVMVADRVAVAFIKVGKATEQTFVDAMVARVAAGSSTKGADEDDGSFMALTGKAA